MQHLPQQPQKSPSSKSGLSQALSHRRLNANKSALNYICGKQQGLSTGLPGFDRQLRGLQGLVCVMGEPKANKSTTVLQWGIHHALNVGPTYYLDLENGIPLLSKRILCHTKGISEEVVKAMPEEQVAAEFNRFCSQVPFWACDESLEFEKVESEVEQLLAFGKPTVLIIDSIQWLRSKQVDKRLKIDEWVAKLDNFKLRYRPQLTIICISEKNRSGYKLSSVASAKESGSIEYKAEQLIDLQIDEDTGEIIMQCVANRHGPKGATVRLEKVMASAKDPHSFTFTMREVGSDLKRLTL